MLTFKTATTSDLLELVELINSAYRGDLSKAGWTTEAYLLDGQRTDCEALQEIISTPENEIILAFEEDVLIGSVHIKLDEPATLYFGMLTVKPTLQSKGFGKEIIEKVEEIARFKNCKGIRISVIQYRDELIAYYERRGFQRTGKFEAFPSHDPRFGIPKRDDLKLLEFIKTFE